MENNVVLDVSAVSLHVVREAMGMPFESALVTWFEAG